MRGSDEAQENLVALAEGELSPETCEWIEAHLAECEVCAEEAAPLPEELPITQNRDALEDLDPLEQHSILQASEFSRCSRGG